MPERVTGPAFYFPSIEKKYGKPISYWLDLIGSSELTKHKELVDWLKGDHHLDQHLQRHDVELADIAAGYGIGHGHATALVGYALAQRAGGESPHPGPHPEGTDPA